jgi:hypothetical protein
MPTHDPHDPHHSTDPHAAESESAGYEITDVEVNGIAVFLASLAAFVGVFFVVCFVMGKVINTAIIKSDGPPNKWNQIGSQPRGKREDLTSNAVMEQQQLNQMVQRFPTPRLQTDDGNHGCLVARQKGFGPLRFSDRKAMLGNQLHGSGNRDAYLTAGAIDPTVVVEQ